MAEVIANPVIRRLIGQSTPFAEHLKEAIGEAEFAQFVSFQPEPEVDPAPDEPESPARADPAHEPQPEPVTAARELRLGAAGAEVASAPVVTRRVPVVPPSDESAGAVVDGATEALVEAGLSPAVARAAVEEVERHVRPFAPHEAFTTQLRRVLCRRIPVAHGFGGNRRTIALAGPSGAGKTLAAARIARAYASAGAYEVAVLDLAVPGGSSVLRGLLDGTGIDIRWATAPEDVARAAAELSGRGRILVVDTPPALGAGPRPAPRPAELLAAVAPDEVHVVLPAAMDDGLAAFVLDAVGVDASRDRLLLTHLDESPRAGGVLGLAIERRIPVSYLSSGPWVERGLRPADPAQLASMLLR
jgi:flagellar biosynthesis protein FlhF